MNRIYTLLLVVLLFSCESSEERRDRFFQMGNRAISEGAYKEAIEFYNQSLKEDPNYSSALNNRGVARMETGHAYEAILDYNQAIAMDASYKDALLNRAYAYEEIGQFEKALKDVERVEQLVEDSSFVSFYKGLVLTKVRRYDEAYQAFSRSDSLNPLNPETIVNLATIHYFKGELDVAEKKLDQALDLQANDPNVFNLKSLIALERKDYLGALADINRAMDEVPDEPYFINNRGFVFLQMDSLDLAIEDINKSIVLNPKNGWAYRNKGIYWLKKGNDEEAIRLLIRASDSGEFIDEIYFYLGQAHLNNQNTAEACLAWKKGAEQNEIKSIEMLAQNCD